MNGNLRMSKNPRNIRRCIQDLICKNTWGKLTLGRRLMGFLFLSCSTRLPGRMPAFSVVICILIDTINGKCMLDLSVLSSFDIFFN
jgi:hypothetical protein